MNAFRPIRVRCECAQVKDGSCKRGEQLVIIMRCVRALEHVSAVPALG